MQKTLRKIRQKSLMLSNWPLQKSHFSLHLRCIWPLTFENPSKVPLKSSLESGKQELLWHRDYKESFLRFVCFAYIKQFLPALPLFLDLITDRSQNSKRFSILHALLVWPISWSILKSWPLTTMRDIIEGVLITSTRSHCFSN